MFAISFKDDFDKLRKGLQDDQKQVRFAMMLALNRTMVDVKEGIRSEMGKVFDRPTPYTLNSLRTIGATKANLTAYVWVKDEAGINDASKYLNPEIAGGPREHKPFEKRLIRGGFMPATMYAVPGQRARLNRYGNITGGELERILSAIGAAEQFAGYQANRTAASGKKMGKRRRDFFVVRPGGASRLRLGIWERTASGVRPVIMFVRRPAYHRRLDFNGVGYKIATGVWARRVADAIEYTLRTRR